MLLLEKEPPSSDRTHLGPREQDPETRSAPVYGCQDWVALLGLRRQGLGHASAAVCVGEVIIELTIMEH